MSGVSSVPWFVWEPTATTVPSLRAVTAASPLEAVPGSGLLTIVRVVPSQCSVKVEWLLSPTAQMSSAEMAAIPLRVLFTVPTGFGFGLGTMLPCAS
jgi:hypothetical protein